MRTGVRTRANFSRRGRQSWILALWVETKEWIEKLIWQKLTLNLLVTIKRMNYLFGFRNSRGFWQTLATNSANIQVVFHSQKTFAKFLYNFCKIEHTDRKFAEKLVETSFSKKRKKLDAFLLNFWGLNGAKGRIFCKSRQELSNEYLVLCSIYLQTFFTIGFDTAENELLKVCRWFNSVFQVIP